MFFPRLITLLVSLCCAVIALLASSEYLFVIPLPFMKWAVVIVASFFSTSAVVMVVGLTDAKRTENGELEFGTTLRGRMMRKITERGGWWREKHCCDVYIDTSLMSFMAVVAAGAVAFLFYAVLNKTVEFFSGVIGLAAFFGLVLGLVWCGEKLTAYMKQNRRQWKKFSLTPTTNRVLGRVVVGVICALFGLVICGTLFVLVYGPIAELMKLGYTLLGATALYLGLLALLPVPLYCLVGKKLLLGTKLGEKICPIVRP